MASTTFSGPVTSTNGFIGNVTGAVLAATALRALRLRFLPPLARAPFISLLSEPRLQAIRPLSRWLMPAIL